MDFSTRICLMRRPLSHPGRGRPLLALVWSLSHTCPLPLPSFPGSGVLSAAAVDTWLLWSHHTSGHGSETGGGNLAASAQEM